jgi:acylaminoacyl-peptidase
MNRVRLASPLSIALTLSLLLCAAGAQARTSTRGMTVDDLVRLERVSDPHISPDGRYVAYQLRETDYEGNKGVNGLWLLDLKAKDALPRRLTAPGDNSTAPRWSPDGRSLYFLSGRSGSDQVWKLPVDGGEAYPATQLPLDVNAFVLSPDGRRIAVSLDVFPDCATLDCTRQRLDRSAAQKKSGQLYDRLFVRHWDTWAKGTRSQLFAFLLDDYGRASGTPAWVSKGIDGDVPSKPFGDDSEIIFSKDGERLVFTARIAGGNEPWSTNFDLWLAPADGSAPPYDLTEDNPAADTAPVLSPDGAYVAYRAQRRPGFESDRYAIMVKHLESGVTREVAPGWDRSAEQLAWSPDGHTLYATADDVGQHRLFAIDAGSGSVRALTDEGHVESYDVSADGAVVALNNLATPTQLYRVSLKGGEGPKALTRHNAARLSGIAMGDYEQFSFPGWNDETVYGYVIKPANYKSGRKYPVAFIIHGGPQASFQNLWHYRWNAQTYAGAGYAVVMIDFHGSPGYGQAFTDSISQHWGDRPLEDLQKAWAYALSKYDFLDGAKACALGASYGGYMVNWIAGRWNDPWKCLVVHDGVFDNRMMGYSTEELWFSEWENGGTPYEHPENYERYNPANYVGQWKLPQLVIQGGRDYRIPAEQGLAAFSALQRRGIPSQFLYFPDENHWVLKPQNAVQWHEVVFAWMKRWTGED